VALVEPPVLHFGQPRPVQLVEREPQGADGALEHRGERKVEGVAARLEQAACGAGFLDAFLRQVDVGPAGEAILAVPVGLAVPQKDQLVHHAEL